MLHLVPLVTGLRPSSPWSGSHPRSRSLLRGGAAPRAELSFGSEADYESWLVAESPLPQGFRVATGGFSFVPQEAPIPSIMNLTMIVLDAPSEHFAACFTNNALCGSPITVGRKRLAESPALQAIVVNNKISNVCAAGDGIGASEAVCAAAASALGIESSSLVVPSSTGIIGWKIPVDELSQAARIASRSMQAESVMPAAVGICTTDAFPKVRSASVGGGRIVGIAKGAGMVEPNLATMLVFILTDCDVARDDLDAMLTRAAAVSFNAMSIDSDQSTSDTLLALSSRLTAVPSLAEFEKALVQVCQGLALDVVRNGEGTQHVIRVTVSGAPSYDMAVTVGKAVINSPLVKCAIAGNDPNVGRLVGAIGSTIGNSRTSSIDLNKVRLKLGGLLLFENGCFANEAMADLEPILVEHLKKAQLFTTQPTIVSAEAANRQKVLSATDLSYASAPSFPPHQRCVEVGVELNSGDARATVLGSDLTHEYVAENADYRS